MVRFHPGAPFLNGCLPTLAKTTLRLYRLRRLTSLHNNNKSHYKVCLMDNKIVAALVSFLLPPLAVFLKKGAGKDLIINLILCLFLWVPAILHAMWLTVLS